eukprot:s2549_g12.t1
MDDILEMDENFEIVKIRIEHSKDDTPAYLWNRQQEKEQEEQSQQCRDKRQVEAPPSRQNSKDLAAVGGSKALARDAAAAEIGKINERV